LEPPRSDRLISTVIIARNEAPTLGLCLVAARQALDAVGGGEILVVDSGSTDSTARVGIESGCRVLSVRKAACVCPSAMRRLGASRTDSRYVLFLDGDCELERGFLDVALKALESDPSLGVVAGRRRDIYRDGQSLVPADRDYYADQRAHTIASPPAYGGCAVYRRRALEEAGSFDPFLRAKEEEDLAQRIRAAGYRIEVLPVPMIRHMTIPRESFRRLLRSLSHGFYIGRGQATRVFLWRKEIRAALRGLDRVLFTLLHLILGAICLWAAWRGIRWPLVSWLALSLSVFGIFVFRARSVSRAAFYVLEWMIQGVFLVVGLLAPHRSAESFQWEGEERTGVEGGPACLPRVLLAGPLSESHFHGGVEKGVALLLRSDLGRQTSMRLLNTYRTPDPGRPLRSTLTYPIEMIRRLRRELKSRPVDIVHVKTSSGVNFYQNALYALIARLSGVPVLLQIHSGRFETFYRERAPLVRVWIRWTLSSSRRVAVLSRSWAERLAAIAPRTRIRVVPNGLDEEELASLDSGGEIRPSQVLFLGTGRADLNRDKGLQDILSVLPELARRHPQSRWILAGLQDAEGTYARLRREGVDPEGEERRVRCMGLLDRNEKWDLLKTSSILLLPSYFENMPNVLLEGMAAGLGVVATDVGAIPEMLGDGEGGVLITPGDRPALASALERLLGLPPLVLAQGRRNRLVVKQHYTMRAVQERLEELYLETAGWPVMTEMVGSPLSAVAPAGVGREMRAPSRPLSTS
jgi:glycosyltransferase involved in cell wall biosynthesis